MSEMISPDLGTPTEDERPADRRNFLSRSGLMIALLALAGGEGVADADVTTGPASFSSSEVPSLNAVLNEAIQIGKINATSPAFLKLNKSLQGSLLGLSAGDLATLRSAKAILSSHLNFAAAGDNNGSIGM